MGRIINCKGADELVESMKFPRSFEITATYTDVDDSRIMTSLSVSSGRVLVVPRVYDVDGISVSTSDMQDVTIKLNCYKIGTIESSERSAIVKGSEHWEAWLESPQHSRTFADDKRILGGYSYPLIIVRDGVLVEDNRSLICINTIRKTLQGKENVEYLDPVLCGPELSACPYLGSVLENLSSYVEECNDLLSRLGG